MKRGSLLFLLMKDLPLEVIRTAAKHKSIQQLLTYLPAGPVANRVGLADRCRSAFWPLKLPLGKSDSNNEPEMVSVLVDSAGANVVCQKFGRRREKPPGETKWRNVGELANVPSSRINIQETKALAMEEGDEQAANLIGVLDGTTCILSEEGRKNLRRARIRKLSRYMTQHEEKMLQQGILERGPAVAYLPLFTTEKKSGKLRLILNAKAVNKYLLPTPVMPIPHINDVIQEVLSANFATQADGSAYFYQMPMHDSLKELFGVRLAGKQGKVSTYRMSVPSLL